MKQKISLVVALAVLVVGVAGYLLFFSNEKNVDLARYAPSNSYMAMKIDFSNMITKVDLKDFSEMSFVKDFVSKSVQKPRLFGRFTKKDLEFESN